MEAALKEAHFLRQARKARVKRTCSYAGVTLYYWEKTGDELGSTLWASARDLCELIEHNSSVFEGKTVLELGAGLGLPGILSSYSADTVHLTDKPSLVSFLTDNIQLNSRSNVTAMELEWGSVSSALLSSYDVVIGADIVYADNSLPQLVATLLAFTHVGSAFVLAYRPRVPTQETVFFTAISPYFALVSSVDLAQSAVMHFTRTS
jgi:predicted nicotinamide N-methyase